MQLICKRICEANKLNIELSVNEHKAKIKQGYILKEGDNIIEINIIKLI